MASIVRNVCEIDKADRDALERIVGQTLRDDERLLIQLASELHSQALDGFDMERTVGELKVGELLEFIDKFNAPETLAPVGARPRQQLSDFTSFYDGMSEQEIEEFDRAINTRANLTRNLP